MKVAFEKSSIFNLADSIEYSQGGVISKQVIKNQAGNISLFSFDKGQGLSEHSAPYDALIQILEGESEIKIADKIFNLKANDTIILPANIPHALYAVTAYKMLLTMIKGD